jgi:hypothetical protein
MHYHVVASPEYLARRGRPRTPSELHGHNCIRYRLPDGRFIPWIFVVDGKTAEFDIEGSVVVLNDPELVISAALAGIGVAYLYEEYVAAHIADGRLVSLLDKSALPVTEGFFMFYPSRRQNPAALRVLIEFLRSELRGKERATELSTPAQVQSLAASSTWANQSSPSNRPLVLGGNKSAIACRVDRVPIEERSELLDPQSPAGFANAVFGRSK